MKKNIYISLILISVMSMMAHAFVPHHEHVNTLCFEYSLCHDNQSLTHNDTNPQKKQVCNLDNQEIIQPQSKEESEHGCNNGLACDMHFPPIMLFIGDFFGLKENKTDLIEKPYLNLYSSADTYSANTRRGPPQI